MWPFSEMSLPAASLVGTIANWALLVSLIGGLLSTFVIVKTTDVKEEHWAEDRRKSNEKIAEVGAQGDQARAELGTAQVDIAKANVQIATANEGAAQARLETEKLKEVVAWRAIPATNAAELERRLAEKPGSVNLRYMDGDPEALFLAIQISKILGKANWQVATGAVKPAGTLMIGISIANTPSADAQTLRSAFSAAKVAFSDDVLPMPGISFGISQIAGAPILMVGSKAPPQLP